MNPKLSERNAFEVVEVVSLPRNEAMLAVLQRSAERMKDVPVTGLTEENSQADSRSKSRCDVGI
jgi:hypothetical protein